MFNTRGPDDPLRIVVLNPKGGSGKSTLATNLASIFALRDIPPTLVDCDSQGYCSRWLDRRPRHYRPIYGATATIGQRIEAARMREAIHPESDIAVFDLPAGIRYDQLYLYTHGADAVLIPINPSPIDVHAATRLISELLLDVQIDRRDHKLGIVANRVRANTRSFGMLQKFLGSLSIPMVAALRDAQIYVRAAAEGMGICELPPWEVREELVAWKSLMQWLSGRVRQQAAAQSPLPARQPAGTESQTTVVHH